jgi:acyl dehydratase
MTTPRIEDVTVGQALTPLKKPPLTTRQLVEYAGASLDFNRIHYDEPFAKAGGFRTVIAHGMLSMAFLGEAATTFAGGDPARVVKLGTRFKAVAYPGDVITVEGTVASVDPATRLVELSLTAKNQEGTVTLEGRATVRL